MIKIDNKSIEKGIKGENYFSNCYRALIRSKFVHFLFILIEMLLILFQEIDIYQRGYKPRYKSEGDIIISPIILLVHIFDKFETYINFLIIILSLIIFDTLYIYLCKNDIKDNNIFLSIIVNFLELFYFRIYTLFFFSLLFCLPKLYFLISFALSLIHSYLIINNFFYNHLYFYVPEFINYPYDQFGSIYDLFLFLSKIIISIASSSTQVELGKFCFVIVFIFQLFFCFYFTDKLFNHSYLFMKNSFLNRTKISLFLAETTIILFAFFIGQKNIFRILFILITIAIIIIYIGFLYFIYDPYSYIHIKNGKNLENMFYYLNMINKKNDIEFLIENKLSKHYRDCGLCKLCIKYEKYRTEDDDNKNRNDNEKESYNESDSLINVGKKNNNNKINDLFDLLYDGKNKYFKLIRKLLINYKKYGKNIFNNNAYYYINLSYLIYSDYLSKEITLSLNEKIILEIVNEENHSFLENHQAQINQLILCNEFISLGKKILLLIKDILRDDQNFFKAKKLISLSDLLQDMKKPVYKKNIFSHKLENATNSKNILIVCSIIYEEIFNTILSNSQLAIRDNLQTLEDVFNNSSKNNNIITLEVDLINYNCKIIRAGKGLYYYINKNLYDLFPQMFKQHQINLFLNSIFTGFNNDEEKLLEKDNKKIKNITKKGKAKVEFVEIKVVLYEKILDKIYFKLLTLRLTSLFNNDNNHFILFNGTYSFNKNTIISVIDLSHKSETEEKVLGVSDPDLEDESEPNFISSLPLKKYISWQEMKGYKLKKIYSYQISVKLYSIYILELKNEGIIKKKEIAKQYNKLKSTESENSSEDLANDRLRVYEETNSVSSSVQTSTYSKGISSIGIKKMRKDNIIKYTGFNQIQKTIYFSIFLVIIIIIVEYLYFDKLKRDANNNNYSYINYRGFYRLYYQLFASILGVTCIPETLDSKTCRNYISIFNKVYSKNYPDKTFDFTEYLMIQNEIFAKKIVEEKANIIKINEYIGEKRYNELFNTKIKYIQINQRYEGYRTAFSIKETTINFFDALLILCNSFGILTENPNNTLTQPIYFLNKLEDPFSNLIYQNQMTTYQEEVYKLILNYKYYSKQFSIIDKKLYTVLNQKSELIRIIIFVFVNINTLLYLIIGILMYIFLICFKKIIIRVLNYVIMIINTKSDGFDFKSTFSQKIENLEIILELYKSSPLEAVQNLNVLYNEYNQYLINKNKSALINSNKKNINKKNTQEEEHDIDEVPKNQQLISIKDVDRLNINNKYQIILLILVIIIIIIYLVFLYMWFEYFSKRANLFNIITKNAKLEESCYEAVNMYELMIFNNYTLDEMIDYLELDNNNSGHTSGNNNTNSIFNSFYQNLYLVFEFEKYHKTMGDLYQDFEDLAEFNCINMVVTFHYEVLEIVDERMTDLDLKQKLVDICVISHITESKNLKTIFERHFQFMKNGMLSLTDFSYEGLNKNLDSTIIGRIAFFFFTTTIYIIDITTSIPHKNSVHKIMELLGNRILITEIIFLIFGVALILIILFFYIYNINKFCKQIFLLKKTFNIFEMHEQ